jgi:hypothetical protein
VGIEHRHKVQLRGTLLRVEEGIRIIEILRVLLVGHSSRRIEAPDKGE